MLEKRHLAYLCSSKSWGGLEMNQLRNAEWMKTRGHEVVVLASLNSAMANEAKSKGISVKQVPTFKKHLDLKGAFQLAKIIKELEITHLILRDPKEMSVAGLAKRFSKKKFFLAYFMEMQIGIPKRDFIHTMRYKQFDLWACPLPWLQKQVHELTRYPQERTVVIPSGIELKQFFNAPEKQEAKRLLDLNSDKKHIGLAGRLDPQKGQLLLLDAFHQVHNELTDYNLVFLGESTQGEYEEYPRLLDNYISRTNMQGRVHFRPFRKDVETFYAAMDIFVMGTKSETFGMVTVEALASGCKIVGSNRGGTVEILENGALGKLYESEDADDLARKILEIANEEGGVKERKNAAKKYDHHTVCAQVENALFI